MTALVGCCLRISTIGLTTSEHLVICRLQCLCMLFSNTTDAVGPFHAGLAVVLQLIRLAQRRMTERASNVDLLNA